MKKETKNMLIDAAKGLGSILLLAAIEVAEDYVSAKVENHKVKRIENKQLKGELKC